MNPVSSPGGVPLASPATYDAPTHAQDDDTTTQATPQAAPGGKSVGDAWGQFGSPDGLHPQVQQFAHGAPNGAGGGAATGTSVDAKAAAQQAEAQALMDKGVRLLKAHDYEGAIKAFEEGFLLHPSPKFSLNIAAALRDSGRYAEAVLAYERYLGTPDAPRADEARKAMEETRTHLGGRTYTNADIVEAKRLTDEGGKAFAEGRLEDAYKAWSAAYEHNPLPKLLHSQGICMERLGANYSAAKLFRAYAAADPKAAPKDVAEFSARAERLQALAERSPITAGGLAGGMEWMECGNRLLKAHRYDEAIAAYDQGFLTHPSESFILNKASALLDSGRYAEADLAYGRYLINPDAPRADEAREAQLRAREHMGGREATITGVAESQRLTGEGEALYKAGKFADALQAFERAYALNPLADLRYNQAACMEKMGAREMAASRYGDYLKEAPNAKDAAQVRTHITKLHDEAKAAAQTAFDRGQQAFAQGDFKAAASAFIEAYSHLPLPQFLHNAGAAYHKAGDTANAVRYYQLYLSMAPNAPDAGRIHKAIEILQQPAGSASTKPVDEVAKAKLQAAQQAFDKGQKAYEQGRWTDASRHFADAYAQRPFPQFLYNVAASLHRAGDTMGAVKAYQQYLNAFPDAPDADKVRKTIQLLLERSGDALMRP